jgi:hypothetical protein
MLFSGKWMVIFSVGQTHRGNYYMFSLRCQIYGEKQNTKVKGPLLGVWKRKRGRKEEGKDVNRVINMITVHYIHVWKCHNECHYFVYYDNFN